MRVRLQKTFFWNGFRYRKNVDGVEVPDDAILPSTAEVWRDGRWQKQSNEERTGFRAQAAMQAQDADVGAKAPVDTWNESESGEGPVTRTGNAGAPTDRNDGKPASKPAPAESRVKKLDL